MVSNGGSIAESCYNYRRNWLGCDAMSHYGVRWTRQRCSFRSLRLWLSELSRVEVKLNVSVLKSLDSLGKQRMLFNYTPAVTVKNSFGWVTLTLLVEVSKASCVASENAGGKVDSISNIDGLLLSRGTKLLIPTQFSVRFFDWSPLTHGSVRPSSSAFDSHESPTTASSIMAWARRCLFSLPVRPELAFLYHLLFKCQSFEASWACNFCWAMQYSASFCFSISFLLIRASLCSFRWLDVPEPLEEIVLRGCSLSFEMSDKTLVAFEFLLSLKESMYSRPVVMKHLWRLMKSFNQVSKLCKFHLYW